MAERGRFRRAVDSAVEYSREHRGMSASGGLIAGGAAVEVSPVPGKEVVAIPMFIVGGIVGIASSLVEYYDRVIVSNLPRRSQQDSTLAAGFHDDETTIMSTEEIASAMTASTKEGSRSS